MTLLIKQLLRRLEQFKVGRGKWNLEVTTKAVENIEKSLVHLLLNQIRTEPYSRKR